MTQSRGARSFGAPLSGFHGVAGARVAVVSTSFPAHPGDPSGHFVAAHVVALAAHGARVDVLVPGPSSLALPPHVEVVPLGGAPLFAWPGAVANVRRAPWRLLAAPSFGLRAHAQLASRLPDRIVAHWAIPSAFPICWGLPSPLELWWHGADARLLARLPGPIARGVLSSLIERAQRMCFVAQALFDDVRVHVPAPLLSRFDSISTIAPAPIEVPSRDALPSCEHLVRAGHAGRRYVVWCGRDVTSKRLALAIDATRRAGLPIVVVGATRGVTAREDAHVTYLGARPRPEALAIIAGAAALLSTSDAEGAPTVVREARAYDVPVVATAAGDLVRWAASDPGITVVDADEVTLARTLARAVR